MSTVARASSLRRILPLSVFDQIADVMQQTASAIAQNALVVTEITLPGGQWLPLVERFVVIVCSEFSALLWAEPVMPPDEPGLNHVTALVDRIAGSYQVGLTFEPTAIADFLERLSAQMDNAATGKMLLQASDQLQPNDPTIQADFTLRLIDILAVPTSGTFDQGSCAPFVATALQQQVEQERLLNEVTVQIRKSLELSDILKAAVNQVRQILNADRVVIYEFSQTAIAALRNRSGWANQAEHARTVYGSIVYEAKATETLPTVLGMQEGLNCFPDLPNHHERYTKGFIEAIDDIEATFVLSPCLLQLLRRADVRAKMVVPILVQNEAWGLLIVHQKSPRHWQDYEQIFFQRIAEHLAIAIYQSNLYTQLQHQKQMLEQRVAKRTQDLDDALVAAQAANRAKGEFLAAMSHELRTPLTCVIGMAETLLRAMSQQPGTSSLKPEKQAEYLKIIKKSGEHLLELINDILDVSQVEAGKVVLTVSQFSLAQLAHQCLQMIREKATSSGVELVMDLCLITAQKPAAETTFVADRRRVSQILLNLLSNAIKFTPAGGQVTLRIWMENNTAVFQVEDTGIGIPANQQPLLFQKFQQLDTVYHRKYEGTGLGLALTKQLVELHGGTIEVDSTVGLGSTFTVHVPAQSISKASKFPPAASDLMVTDTDSNSYTINFGGRIALVEDHEETAMLICDLLTAAGCQVVWMVDGSTAIKQIEVLQPSLVITDIQLPGMDGFEIMRYLRSRPQLQTTKLLVLSARTSLTDQEQCLLEGADDYLTKPLQPYQLLDKVAALVQQID